MNAVPLVDLKAQYASIKSDIDSAVARVIEGAAFIGGQELAGFEAAFAAYQHTIRCVGVASGTAALFLTLKALGVGPGDEVITTPFTFIATIEAITMTGATPVLADIDPDTCLIDPAAAEAVITPRTKVLLPVHLYGQLANMDALIKVARRHALAVVEDAAQAHGASLPIGRRAGAWGIAACFSFYPGKNLGAFGDAGAVCTNDPWLSLRIARLRDHGRSEKYTHLELGYGERLDALQAAILAAKLPYLDDWNDARRQNAAAYDEALAGIPGIAVPQYYPGTGHIYHLYCIRAERRDALLASLRDAGIGAGVHYPVPVHLQPALQRYGWRTGDFPHAEAAARSVLSLPLYPEMTPHQHRQVVEVFHRAAQNWH